MNVAADTTNDMKIPLRKALIAILAVGMSLGLSALVCEMGFRLLLFSDLAFMKRFQDPYLYTDYDSDGDWWKLYYLFGLNQAPKHAHPLLGWTGEFDDVTYRHREADRKGSRRAVLLYGDSFTHCWTTKAECFQGILNGDKEFAERDFVLNYGVSGYGVDQIYLLLNHSVDLYDNPYVVVGLYTRDVDRTIMPYFVGQKPYFELESDELVLRGVPIDMSPERYLADHPPKIWSYLYRLWLYQEWRPWRIRQYLRGTEESRHKKTVLNEKIILKLIEELEARHLAHLFVIYCDLKDVDKVDWHEELIAHMLSRHGTPYVSAREVISQDRRHAAKPLQDYYLHKDGHPSAYQNLLIARELKRRILNEGLAARVK